MAELNSTMMKDRGAVLTTDLPDFKEEIVQETSNARDDAVAAAQAAEMYANETAVDAENAAESASRAEAAVGKSGKALIAAGTSGPIYGAAGAGQIVAHRVLLEPNAIVGGATLRFHMQLVKHAPFNASHSWRLRIGSRVVSQNTVGATISNLVVEQILHFAYDRKSCMTFDQNVFGMASVNTAGLYANMGARTGSPLSLGARATGTTMFVEYSSPPTVETVVVDFSAPVEIVLEVRAQNGDVVEAVACSLEVMAAGDAPVNTCNPTALSIWGDSLVEGSGSAPESNVPMDFPSQLRRLMAGTPVAARGLGGQRAAQIVGRLLSDPILGGAWNSVIWAGTNDFAAANGPAWWAAIKSSIDAAMNFRQGKKTIVINMIPRASWAVGDANYQAMQFVNSQIAATYGEAVCDVFSALATDAGKIPASLMADDVHLSNAGYTVVSSVVFQKINDDWL